MIGPSLLAKLKNRGGLIVAGFLLTVCIPRTFAGTVEDGFNPGNTYPDDKVIAVGIRSDGKYLLHDGTLLNRNGTRDTNYDLGPDNSLQPLRSAYLLNNGQLLVAGAFTSLNDGAVNRAGLARLDEDGSVDQTFPDVQIGGLVSVNKVLVQLDGKILIVGEFDTVAGQPRENIARLNADGSLDTGFSVDALDGLNTDEVFEVEIQRNNKILIGGSFNAIGGITRKQIARLNPDGSLDPGFDPHADRGGGAEVTDIDIQGDGKIVYVGNISSVNETVNSNLGFVSSRYISRILPDGSPDPEFLNPGPSGGSSPGISSVEIAANGKFYVYGRFEHFGALVQNPEFDRDGFARLNADGTVDEDFIFDINLPSRELLLGQENGKLLMSQSNSVGPFLVRLNEDRTEDVDFNPGANGSVRAFSVQDDHKIVVGGSFTQIGGENINRIARLNADGSIDETFFSASGLNQDVLALATLADGSVMVGGRFNNVGINPRLIRILKDGALDTDFILSPNGEVQALLVRPDGKVLVAGEFSGLSDFSIPSFVSRAGIALVNVDGTVDNSFVPELGDSTALNTFVSVIALQPDGKVLVGGRFKFPNKPVEYGFFRLNADGSLDDTFAPEPDRPPFAMLITPDNKILASGSFGEMAGEPSNRIARINANGNIDDTFDADTQIGGTNGIFGLNLQVDGKMVVGGDFSGIGGEARQGIARLNSDGSADNDFVVGDNSTTTLLEIMAEQGGKILAGGSFTSLGSETRDRLARIAPEGGGTSRLTFNADTREVNWYRFGQAPVLQHAQLQTSMDGENWQTIKQLGRVGSTSHWQATLDTSPVDSQFIRALGFYGDGNSMSVLDVVLPLAYTDDSDADILCIIGKSANGHVFSFCL